MNKSTGLWIITIILAIAVLPQVMADINFGSHMTTTGLNFYQTETNRTVYIHNEAAPAKDYVITIPSGWTAFNDGPGCNTTTGQIVSCSIGAGFTWGFRLQSPTNVPLYTRVTINATSSSGTINNMTMLMIPPTGIFSTLVEYGRGRGNYPFSSDPGNNTKGGCPYLPNGTGIELNFLHKVWPIKQFFTMPPTTFYGNATYKCTYPNNTIIREHLATSIFRSSTGWNVTFRIDEIEGAWERFGFIGMHIDPGDYNVGQNITINCTDIKSQYIPAGGNFSVTEDSFKLQFRNREPFVLTESTSTTSIGNGTQEVEITYTVTNAEVYAADAAQLEIRAPDYSAFIGSRGELWGTAQDRYTWELTEMGAGETATITLVARFNTSNMPPTTSIGMCGGAKFKYITCWEANAYNPVEYFQVIQPSGCSNVTVDLSRNTTIINIPDSIRILININILLNETIININNTINVMNSTINLMNQTLNSVNYTINYLNGTVTFINGTIVTINNTINNLYNLTLYINGTTTVINNTVYYMNGTLTQVNSTVQIINTTVNSINNTVNNINTTISIINTTVYQTNQTVNNINTTITIINNTVNYLNGSITNINETVTIINNTVTGLNNSFYYFNQTLNNITIALGNITNILGNLNVTIGNISISVNNSQLLSDTKEILRLIRQSHEDSDELVFLVTDAFGLQQAAEQQARKGDTQAAMTSLKEANEKLKQAADRIAGIQANAAAVSETKVTDKTSGFLMTMLIILACVLAYVYFTRDVRQTR